MSIAISIENFTGALRQAPTVNTANSGGVNVAGGQSRANAATGIQAGSANEPASSSPQLSPGFTVVVLQLLNQQGAVVSTIPTQQQLNAYRNGTAPPPNSAAS